ncbi:hypothetical protein D3C78_1525770 [compost metagenome]
MRQFPAVGIFTFGVIRGGIPDGIARRGAAGHGTGIGAVQGEGFPFRGNDVRQKAFVTFNQRGVAQRWRKNHGVS